MAANYTYISNTSGSKERIRLRNGGLVIAPGQFASLEPEEIAEIKSSGRFLITEGIAPGAFPAGSESEWGSPTPYIPPSTGISKKEAEEIFAGMGPVTSENNPLGSVSGSVTPNLNAGHVVILTVTGTAKVKKPINWPSSAQTTYVEYLIKQDATGGHTVEIEVDQWFGEVPEVLTAPNAVSTPITLVSYDGGTTVYGIGLGASSSSDLLTPTVVKTAAYTAAPSDFIPVDISGGSVPVKLPTAPADKTRIGTKIVAVSGTPGSTTLTINCGGSDVFNIAAGSTTLTYSAKFQSVLLQYSASAKIWYALSTDTPLNEALGGALLGTDGTVGGPSGSPLSASMAIGSLIAPCVATVISNVASRSGIPASSVTDGVSTEAGQRVLLIGQTTKSQNGPWVLSAGAWSRPADFPAAGVHAACSVLISGGELLGGSQWYLRTTGTITIDTTAQTWSLARPKESELPGRLYDVADWGILPTNTAAENTAAAIKLCEQINSVILLKPGGTLRFKFPEEYLFECNEGTIPWKFETLVNAVMEGVSPGTTRLFPSGTRLVSTVGKGTMVKWGDGSTELTKRAVGGTRHIEFYGHEQEGEEPLVWAYRGLFMSFEDTRIAGCGGTAFRMTELNNSFFDKFCIRFSGKGRTAPAMKIDAFEGVEAKGAGGSVINHFSNCEFEANSGTDIRVDGSAENPCRGLWFINCKCERQIVGVSYPCIEENQSEGLTWIGGNINLGGSSGQRFGEFSSNSAGAEGTITLSAAIPGTVAVGQMVAGGTLPGAVNAEGTWANKALTITVKGSVPRRVVAGMSVRTGYNGAAGIPSGATVVSVGAYEESTNTTKVTISAETTAANAAESRVSFGGAWVTELKAGENKVKYVSTSATVGASVGSTVVFNGTTSRLLDKWANGQRGGFNEIRTVAVHHGCPDYFFNQETGRFALGGTCNSLVYPVGFHRIAPTVQQSNFTYAGTIFDAPPPSSEVHNVIDERTKGNLGEPRDVSLGVIPLAFTLDGSAIKGLIGPKGVPGFKVRHEQEDTVVCANISLPLDYAENTGLEIFLDIVTPNESGGATTVRWAVLWKAITGVNISTLAMAESLASTNNAAGAFQETQAITTLAAASAGVTMKSGTKLAFTLMRQGKLGTDTQIDTVFVTGAELRYKRISL